MAPQQGTGFSLPAAPDGRPGLPESFELLSFRDFSGGLNLQDDRTGIGENELSWCDNYWPRGKNYLYPLPYPSVSQWQVPSGEGGEKVGWFDFYIDINGNEKCLIWLLNSHLYLLDVGSGASALIDNTGRLPFHPQMVQWNQYYVLLVGGPGVYFIWNGASFFGAGSVSPYVNITNGGIGYSSMPTITPFGGTGSGSTYSSQIVGDSISQVLATSPGSGYVPNDYVALAFSGGGCAGSTAILNAGLSGAQIIAINPAYGGAGYTSEATIDVYGGGGAGALATPNVFGELQSITITNGGSGFTSQPTVAFSSATFGTTPSYTSIISGGVITAIELTSSGGGWTSPVAVTISGGGGSGATATVSVGNGSITSVTVTDGGSGYITNPTVVVTDPSNPVATANVSLMPIGVGGTSIESYAGRVWVANGREVFFTAAGDPTDFGPTFGGGTFQSNDKFLQEAYVRLIQNNGALYLIGDSSINYVNGVQTSGDPPITTFTNQTVDGQIGTPFVDAPVVRSKSIIFYNYEGIFALYGGSVEKISSKINGLFQRSNFTVFNSNLTSPSSALATIYGDNCLSCLLYVEDVVGDTLPILAMWDGQRWWTSTILLNNGAGPTFIKQQTVASNITTWATDGTYLYKLFSSENIPTGIPPQTYVAQSRLQFEPVSFEQKKVMRYWTVSGTVFYNVLTNYATLYLDNEQVGYAIVPNTRDLEPTVPIPQNTAYLSTTGNYPYNMIYGAGEQVGFGIGVTWSTTHRITLNSIELGWQQYSLRI